MTSSPPRIVVVDGLISAGKSTLISEIQKWLGVRGHRVLIVREPVDDWVEGGHLQKFYDALDRLKSPGADREKVGMECYIFQTFAHVTRVKAFTEGYRKAVEEGFDCVIVERWPTTDRHVFMKNLEGLVGETDMRKYEEWWDFWHAELPAAPDVFIYLRPSLEACMRRKVGRGRDGEDGVDEKYQKELMDLHDAMYGVRQVGGSFVSSLENRFVLDEEHADLGFHRPGDEQDRAFGKVAEIIWPSSD
jgi:deoxyadenosine/deoxycytidine kinase